VRNPSLRAGAWVGASLLMCFWSDLQVFYFTILGVPAFFAMSCISAWLRDPPPWRDWYRVLPTGMLFVAAIAAYHVWKKLGLSQSMMGSGRSWHEVALFSPSSLGWIRHARGVDDTVFIGVAITVAVAAALLLIWWTALARREVRVGHAILYSVVLLGAVGVVVEDEQARFVTLIGLTTDRLEAAEFIFKKVLSLIDINRIVCIRPDRIGSSVIALSQGVEVVGGSFFVRHAADRDIRHETALTELIHHVVEVRHVHASIGQVTAGALAERNLDLRPQVRDKRPIEADRQQPGKPRLLRV